MLLSSESVLHLHIVSYLHIKWGKGQTANLLASEVADSKLLAERLHLTRDPGNHVIAVLVVRQLLAVLDVFEANAEEAPSDQFDPHSGEDKGWLRKNRKLKVTKVPEAVAWDAIEPVRQAGYVVVLLVDVERLGGQDEADVRIEDWEGFLTNRAGDTGERRLAHVGLEEFLNRVSEAAGDPVLGSGKVLYQIALQKGKLVDLDTQLGRQVEEAERLFAVRGFQHLHQLPLAHSVRTLDDDALLLDEQSQVGRLPEAVPAGVVGFQLRNQHVDGLSIVLHRDVAFSAEYEKIFEHEGPVWTREPPDTGVPASNSV